jgi:hypothetical protein
MFESVRGECVSVKLYFIIELEVKRSVVVLEVVFSMSLEQ